MDASVVELQQIDVPEWGSHPVQDVFPAQAWFGGEFVLEGGFEEAENGGEGDQVGCTGWKPVESPDDCLGFLRMVGEVLVDVSDLRGDGDGSDAGLLADVFEGLAQASEETQQQRCSPDADIARASTPPVDFTEAMYRIRVRVGGHPRGNLGQGRYGRPGCLRDRSLRWR